MEEHYTVSPKGSDFYREKKIKESDLDPLAPTHRTWASRNKCFMAYLCMVLCYTSILRFCISLGRHELLIFIPYVVFYIFVGTPALLVEIILGRFVMGNMSRAWSMCPPARGVFWCLFIITGYVILLNHIVNVFILKYLFSSVRGALAWASCQEGLSRVYCYKSGEKSQAIRQCLKNHTKEFCHNLKWQSSATQFWINSMENHANVTEVWFSSLCLLFSVSIIGMILCKHIRSFEKVLDLLIYPSIVLWFIFIFPTFSTKNAIYGFRKLCNLKWSKLLKPKIWIDGLQDTICLLGFGKLPLSYISTHGRFTDNVFYDMLVVIFGGLSSCFLIGFPVLNVISGNKNTANLDTDEPLFQDIPDIFISVSEALLHYPYPRSLWAFVYFLSSFLASTSSQAILVLSFCSSLQGVLNNNGDKAYTITIIAVSIAFFLLGVGFSFLRYTKEFNQLTVSIAVTLLCTITWQFFYGIRKLNYDFYFMMGYPLPIFIRITWMTLPLFTLAALIIKITLKIANREGNYILIYTALVFSVYLIVIIFKIVSFRLRKEKISKVFMADPNWGPDKPILKKSRIVFDTSTVNREFMYRQELYKKPRIKPIDFHEQNIVQLI